MKLIAAALGLMVALQTPRADELAARLRSYLLAYEPKLSELIADETMRQQIDQARATVTNFCGWLYAGVAA